MGILALQGCVEPHAEHLRALGAEPVLVRQRKDLASLQALVLPGGESTTMLKLAQAFGLWDELRRLGGEIPFLGVCAGSILMAKEVENPAQPSLGVFDLKVRRNAYGRQLDSFQQEIEVEGRREAAVFIRAPKFVSWGSAVAVKGRVNGEAVILDDGRHLVAAFHPELSSSHWCHELLLARAQF